MLASLNAVTKESAIAAMILGGRPQTQGLARALSRRVATRVACSIFLGVGSRGYPQPYRTLTARWDGSTWRIFPSPDVQRDNMFRGIAVSSAYSAWAAGLSDRHFPQARQPLIEHWDGSHWGVIDNVAVNGELDGVAVNSPADVWAVGFFELRSRREITLAIGTS